MPFRVLIIEDTATCAELTERKITRWAPEAICDVVVSLAEALALLAQQRYDLITLDLTLIDTWDLMAVGPVVQAARPFRTPVLVLTGARPDLEPQVLEAGAAGYMGKDAPEDAFLHLVTELTRGRAQSAGG